MTLSEKTGQRHPQVALVVKNSPANAGDERDVDLIPESGRSLGGGHGNPLQYSCQENPMDRGAWRATVHGVTKSQTQLSTTRELYSILCNNLYQKKYEKKRYVYVYN